jgi:hypothetical protein
VVTIYRGKFGVSIVRCCVRARSRVGWLAAYDLKMEHTMSNSISTLLLRNLSDVLAKMTITPGCL